MKKGGENVVLKHRQVHSDFIKKSISEGQPANLIVMVDTHSDTFSGQLQMMDGLTGVSTTLSLSDLVRGYVGDLTLQEMMQASALA
jgi:hypothetical protein